MRVTESGFRKRIALKALVLSVTQLLALQSSPYSNAISARHVRPRPRAREGPDGVSWVFCAGEYAAWSKSRRVRSARYSVLFVGALYL